MLFFSDPVLLAPSNVLSLPVSSSSLPDKDASGLPTPAGLLTTASLPTTPGLPSITGPSCALRQSQEKPKVDEKCYRQKYRASWETEFKSENNCSLDKKIIVTFYKFAI